MKHVLDAMSKATPRSQRGIGNVVAVYGNVRGASQTPLRTLEAELLERLGGAVAWQPYAAAVRCSAQPLRSAPSSACLSVVVNWKRISQVLRAAHQRACQKYTSRMFLHWYECYGFEADMFAQAFEVLEEAIRNYEAS
eukprot:TRINITY_DN85470_c0_g1_i1.p1 TRINITY_DN85470_c0_g1~~TRINITY_DN85470_c0_g1_i1.p1  ORF type:complete len:159 (+),score=32.45 TRINITY_DN85470_c0_g1_i1:65-478(+)